VHRYAAASQYARHGLGDKNYQIIDAILTIRLPCRTTNTEQDFRLPSFGRLDFGGAGSGAAEWLGNADTRQLGNPLIGDTASNNKVQCAVIVFIELHIALKAIGIFIALFEAVDLIAQRVVDAAGIGGIGKYFKINQGNIQARFLAGLSKGAINK
jgi:hypothetical protein